MRQVQTKSIAEYLLDKRKACGMLDHEALRVYDESYHERIAQLNQGLPESDLTETGTGEEGKENVEDIDKKKKYKPHISNDG
jgi:hypothetical protein